MSSASLRRLLRVSVRRAYYMHKQAEHDEMVRIIHERREETAKRRQAEREMNMYLKQVGSPPRQRTGTSAFVPRSEPRESARGALHAAAC
eukprot:1281119-Pleurochrysis_carterae.AAC.8